MRFAIVGVGNLGSVLAQSLVGHGTPREQIILISRNPDRSGDLEEALGIKIIASSGDFPTLHSDDCLILAVKPQDAVTACSVLKAILAPNTVVVSMMAGVSVATLQGLLDHSKVARAMPNLGASVQESATAFFIPEAFTESEVGRVQHVINSCGKAWRVHREELIDVATAVAGSGPAYVCWLAEQIEIVAQAEGMSAADAHAIVLQTLKGAVSYLEHDGATFSQLRERVTSPRGTTAAALAVLEEAGTAQIIQRAVRAALQRAGELGKLS